MANTSEKLKLLKQIHSWEEDLYSERNEKYGDSFSTTFQKRGPTVSLIRMEDKLSRADYLLSHGMEGSDGESLIDTLMDLSNYANMTIMELMGQDQVKVQDPKPRKKRSKKTEEPTQTEEKNPLDELSKKQLAEVITQLGGTVPKKANREKLYGVINQFPMAKVAVIITSMKPQAEADGQEGKDGEEA